MAGCIAVVVAGGDASGARGCTAVQTNSMRIPEGNVSCIPTRPTAWSEENIPDSTLTAI